MIAITGTIALLWLIRRSLHRWSRDVLSIHTRMSDLLRHISLGVLFAILLGTGLSAALGAIDALFQVSIDAERYATIFATSGIIVGMISAIDGILFDTSTRSTPTKPKIMLARIIGILIAIFGVILYVYLAQIIITRTRPSNEVARRWFVFVGLVIFGTMMLLPLLDYDEKTITRLHRRAHLILIPILIIISIAILQRVQQYGITEVRYLVILLLIIITGTSIRNIITTKTSPYPLLVALSIGGLIAMFSWPIGMRSISYHSQVARLMDYLTIQDLLIDGQVTLPLDVTDEQASVIAPLLRYFEDNNGRGLPQLHPDLANARELFIKTGIERSAAYNRYDSSNEYKSFGYRDERSPIDIADYSRMYDNINHYDTTNTASIVSFQDNMITISYDNGITIVFDGQSLVDTLSTQDPYNGSYQWSKPILTTDTSALIITTIDLQKSHNQRKIQGINGILLIQ